MTTAELENLNREYMKMLRNMKDMMEVLHEESGEYKTFNSIYTCAMDIINRKKEIMAELKKRKEKI